MKRITFNQFAKSVQHLDTYELTLTREIDSYVIAGVKFWEAEVKTKDNFMTATFIKHLAESNLNIEIRDNKILINNI